jgi:hypothetical protein
MKSQNMVTNVQFAHSIMLEVWGQPRLGCALGRGAPTIG